MKLHKMQRLFSRAALSSNPAPLRHAVAANNNLSLKDRFSVYHNNVTGNLLDALGDTFSATRKLVGDDFFYSMARKFVSRHLPGQANLNFYGADFPAFIKNYKYARSLAYLADVARLEWLWHEAYHAPDDEALAQNEFDSIPELEYPLMCFNLRQSTRLMVSDHPVDHLWRFCQEDGAGDPPGLHNGKVFLLILRPALEVQIMRLALGEYHALTLIAKGKPIGKNADQALRKDPSFDLTAFLLKHFRLNTFQPLS